MWHAERHAEVIPTTTVHSAQNHCPFYYSCVKIPGQAGKTRTFLLTQQDEDRKEATAQTTIRTAAWQFAIAYLDYG